MNDLLVSPRPAGPGDLLRLSALHAASFPYDPWDATALANLAALPGAVMLCLERGFILMRTAADETEVITIAVDPACRGLGIGRRLLLAGLKAARAQGACQAFLEVAVDNQAALALYRQAGFAEIGRRRGYYRRAPDEAVDALVMTARID